MKSDREDYTDSGFETASEHIPKKLRKAPVATIKYAQKIAMQRGDADTYFQRKTAKKNKRTVKK